MAIIDDEFFIKNKKKLLYSKFQSNKSLEVYIYRNNGSCAVVFEWTSLNNNLLLDAGIKETCIFTNFESSQKFFEKIQMMLWEHVEPVELVKD